MRSATAPAVMVAAAAEKAQWNRNSDQLLSPPVLSVVLDRAKSPVPMKPLLWPDGLSPNASPFLQGCYGRYRAGSLLQGSVALLHDDLPTRAWCKYCEHQDTVGMR